jgi:histidyl-tRNA synthetase
MKTNLTSITGFKDILPEDAKRYEYVENISRETFELAGYKEIRTPILERTELFSRSIGETTDIVEKEMYTFQDRNGESLTIRPEGTASVVRAYIEHSIGMKEPIFKIYYIGPMFRHERPQKGRLRQFNQIGAEIFNVASPAAEVELIVILLSIFKKLKITGVKLQINSVGCFECRPAYSEELKKYLRSNYNDLCENCRRRSETNPVRALDCKNEKCKLIIDRAPVISSHLCKGCSTHQEIFEKMLNETQIPFELNPRLVRGLDYYTKTAFELVYKEGAQNAVAAGGRYDNLVEQFGGDPTPAAGFAIGVERLLMLSNLTQDLNKNPSLFIATLGYDVCGTVFKFAELLRKHGVYVETGYGDKSLKSQLRYADKLKAKYVLIIGENELKTKSAILKNMSNSSQEQISIKTEDDFLNSMKGKIF